LTLFAEEGRQRLRLTLAYDGHGFHGFAPNDGVKTVGGTLADAIATVVGHPVEVVCGGRTDTGVHAWGQVVHFDTGAETDLERLHRSLLDMLAPAIVVREASVAPPGFDARRSAQGRRYRYTVLNRPLPDPLLARSTWHVPDPLDLGAMQLASDPLLGEHDWSSFCRRRSDGQGSMVRVVRDARWLDLGEGALRFDIEASSFCHQMVRSLVGTLVAIGLGKKRAGDVAGIIRAKDRALAAEPAPPHGLCLWEVLYE
jgi:tRNA pseudouridine38-40 synthase